MQKVGSSSEGSSPAVAVSTAAAKAIAAKPHACLGAKKDETLPRGVPCVRTRRQCSGFFYASAGTAVRFGGSSSNTAVPWAAGHDASGVAGEEAGSPLFKM